MRFARSLFVAALTFCWITPVLGQFSGTKVVETGVNYPGVGTYSTFVVRPSISGTLTAFGGTLTTGRPSLALAGGTGIVTIADTTTPVPGGTGAFTGFNSSPIGLSGSVYAFGANGVPGPTNAGVYSNSTGALAAVINNGTPYPSGGTFVAFGAPAVSGTTVAFAGTNTPIPGLPTGIFTRTGAGAIATVAGTATAMPTGGGPFATFTDPTFGPTLPNTSGANVVFNGRNAAGSSFGLFLSNGFGLGSVATNTTAIPNGSGTFTAFGVVPALSGTTVAFFGAGAGGQQGVYRSAGGALSRVADTTTPVPGAGGTFTSFLMTDLALSGDRVAFRGTGSTGVTGVYTDLRGTLEKVIATGDTLDGKTVSAVDIGQFAFEGDTIAAMVSFTNGSGGIYRFSPVPEPAGVLGLGVVGFLAARWVRKRKAG